MRHRIVSVVVGIAVCLVASASYAQTSGAVEGFGGLSFRASESNNVFAPNLGGTISVALTPNIQAVGEAGRLGNVLSPLADTVFSFSGTGLQASAFYAEGGVRLLATPHAALSPYVEATAGVARLTVSASGFGGLGDAALPIAVGFLPRTGPVAGVGGGLLLHAGALQVDLGYRFKQLYPPDALGAALGLGQQLRSQQVRFGIGVRF
jgi:hypothetical protein